MSDEPTAEVKAIAALAKELGITRAAAAVLYRQRAADAELSKAPAPPASSGKKKAADESG